MTTNTNASNTEASLSITLTDEALSSLPVYVSRVRELQCHAELETALDVVALEFRSQP